MKVVAIVVTYKRKDLLKKVLSSLSNQTHRLEKIIIIDNNSQDGTEELIHDLNLNNGIYDYYNTGDNLGGAGGFKCGFERASNYQYDYLWLMDDDFSPSESCLAHLLDTAPDSIVQPLRMNLDGSCAEISPVTYNLKNPFVLNPKTKTVADIFNSSGINDFIKIDGVPFEGPLIPKKIIQSVGFPNDKFFIFYDDLDYSIRTRSKGFNIILNHNAIAYRLLKNVQSDDISGWKGYYMIRNFLYINFKYGQNIFVKFKVIPYSCYFILKSVGNIKMLRSTLSAIKDFPRLTNSFKHRP